MDRTIFHCDCNSFYASAELLSRPDLRDKPVAVCGNPENRHGIILAKNEAAKAFGVVTAETIGRAQGKCPGLILLPAHHELYARLSRQINAIYCRYTDQVEPFSIDESWLDVTGSLPYFKKTGRELADELRAAVRQETGVTISVGVSFNKVLAKMGSDYKKPDATTLFTRENFKERIYPLPVSALLFAGRAARRVFARLGIATIGQLAGYPREQLVELLGKTGGTLWDYAHGIDDTPVKHWGERDPIKTIGNSITFRRNLQGLYDIRIALTALSDKVSSRLIRHGLKCRTLQLQIRDPDFRTISRQRPLPHPTYLQKDLFDAALSLLSSSWDLDKPIRMLSLTGAQLAPAEEAGWGQISLFEPQAPEELKKRESLELMVEDLRRRFGADCVTRASILHNDLGIDTALSGRKGSLERQEPGNTES